MSSASAALGAAPRADRSPAVTLGARPRWDGYTVTFTGITWFVGELPARWLAPRGLFIDVIDCIRESDRPRLQLPRPEQRGSWFFDSLAAKMLVPPVQQAIRATGGRIFVSCEEEFWNVPPWVGPETPAACARFEHHLREADSIIVYSARMAEQVQRFNRSIVVMPHALPPLDELPQRAGRPAQPGLRVGWVGSKPHWGDLELVGPAILELLARRPDVTFVLAAGGVAPAGQPRFPPWALRASPHPQIELHEAWVVLPGYYRWVVSLALDVFITPLVDHPFNAVKPCLKPLEAAGLGIPVIASHVGSYAAELTDEGTALVVENTTEAWLGALTRMVEDAELRAHLSSRGLAWAATRTIESTGPLWAKLWGAPVESSLRVASNGSGH